MKRRLSIVMAAGLVVLLGIYVWSTFSDSGPIYKKKPLTFWARKSDKEWGDAVQEVGTNAIPTLLRLMRAQDSKFKTKLVYVAEVQPFVDYKYIGPDILNIRAGQGFKCLGSSAKDAVLELAAILKEDISLTSSQAAAQSLGFIGPAAEAAGPELMRSLTNEYLNVRCASAWALGQIRAQPDVVVPALTECLRHRYSFTRVSAASGLGEFGTNATSSVPTLIQIFKEKQQPGDQYGIADINRKIPGDYVREAIWEALQKIDPEAARKAGLEDPEIEIRQRQWN